MTFSTPKTWKLATAAVLALGALAGPFGCAQEPAQVPTVTALPVDEAMQQRKWEQTPAFYANGSVVAYSTRELIQFPLNTRYLRLSADPSAFMVNSAWALPTLAFDPLMAPVVYHGYQTPPSATAVPPIEPDMLTTDR